MAERPERFVLSSVDWQTIVDALQDGVAVLDEDGHILHCNEAAATFLARSAAQLIGRTPLELDLGAVGEDGSPLSLDVYPSAEAKRTGKAVRERVIGIHHPDGPLRWLTVSATPMGVEARPAAVVLTFRDVTERRDYEAELHRLAEVDELTGLPNRRAFLAVLADHLASRRREDSRGALLVLDLDRFKELNDTLGHGVGDRVLVHAARAMEERLRTSDFLGRLGGDEFAVLLPRASEQEAEEVARALAERLREEVLPTARGVSQVSASIGVVPLSGAAGASVDRALQSADDAMYGAKAAGRDGWLMAHSQDPAPGEGGVALGVQLAKRSRQLALAMRDWSQPMSDGMIGRCLRERVPLLINDVHSEPAYAVTPETADVRSELVAPLLVEGAVWGAINLEELVEDAFDDEDAQLLSILGNQVAAAIRSAQLLQRVVAAGV